MRTLETIARSLKEGKAHPSTVLNALIEAENAGGLPALSELEERLARLERSALERRDPALPLILAWLKATRAYLEEHGQPEPSRLPPLVFRDIILSGPLQSWPRRRVA
jgi:hypothetical protein